VKRPGVRVRARQSYFAARKPSPRWRLSPEPLQAAVEDVLPVTGIPLRASVVAFRRDGHDKDTVVVTIGIEHGAGAHPTPFDLETAVVAIDPKAKIKAQERAALHVETNQSPDPSTAIPLHQFVARVDLPPGWYQLRTAVRCRSDGAVGSVYADVDVPDFKRAPLSLSGIVLSSPTQPSAADVARVNGIIPLVPTTVRTFGETILNAFVRVYLGDASPLGAVVLTATLTTDAGVEISRQEQRETAESFARDRSADATFSLPLTSVASGRLRLNVRAAGVGQAVSRDVPFVRADIPSRP
jgi:hypothetical protein